MKNSLLLMSSLLIGAALVSCNQTPKNQENVEKSTIPVESKQPQVEKTEEVFVPAKTYRVGEQVPNDLVCMVNNAFMGKAQIPVPVNGKTYYGCCEMCVYRLNKEVNSRMATDPFSGKPVDKSEAYIVLQKANGEVAYFESEANYHAFVK
jgi:YHS domain-containing protein